MIDKLVYSYVEHQEKKLHNISMAALVAKANVLLATREGNLTNDQLKLLWAAIDDLNLIMDVYTKEDFKG